MAGPRGPRRLSFQDRVLFSLLSAHLGNALARAIHYEQARDLALALQQSAPRPAGPARRVRGAL